MVRSPQGRIWRFQHGWTEPWVVTGMTHDRKRYAFWRWKDEWRARFGDGTTIYLRVMVGRGLDSPTVRVLGQATDDEWRRS